MDMEKLQRNIEKYLYIMDNYKNANFANPNDKCRSVFNGYYLLSFRNANKEGQIFYEYFESNKNNTNIEYYDILNYLFQKTGRVETSFSSKMLHTINPNMPIFDKKVREKLNLNKIYPKKDKDRQLNMALRTYKQLCDIYYNYFQTQDCMEAINLFDKTFPQYANRVPTVKKIDFFLWKYEKEELSKMKVFDYLLNNKN